MKKEPTSQQVAIQELYGMRELMRAKAANIGEPAIEIPMEDISVFKGENNELRAIIRMDRFIYIVDRVLRG